MSTWRERFNEVEREERSRQEHRAPNLARNRAIDDLFGRLYEAYRSQPIYSALDEIDDLDVLRELLHRAIADAAEWERQLHELEADAFEAEREREGL
jgi:hypothetical protein